MGMGAKSTKLRTFFKVKMFLYFLVFFSRRLVFKIKTKNALANAAPALFIF